MIMDVAIQRLIARRRLRLMEDIALRYLIIRASDFPDIPSAAWAGAVRNRVIQRTAIAGTFFSLIYDQRGLK